MERRTEENKIIEIETDKRAPTALNRIGGGAPLARRQGDSRTPRDLEDLHLSFFRAHPRRLLGADRFSRLFSCLNWPVFVHRFLLFSRCFIFPFNPRSPPFGAAKHTLSSAMDFLKSAVASAIAKGSSFPYSLGDRVDVSDSIWTLHNATKRVRGSSLLNYNLGRCT